MVTLEGNPSRQELTSKGWRQGAFFATGDDAGIARVVHFIDESGQVKTRALQANESLVLISHDCDISQPGFPFLEALVCRKLDVQKRRERERLQRIGPVDPRTFVVDYREGLVVETKYTARIRRDVFASIQGPESTMDAETLQRFREWLAMRFARDAISDRVHRIVFSPLAQILRAFQHDDESQFEILQRVVRQIRVALPEDDDAGNLAIHVLIIIDADPSSMTSDAMDALGELKGKISKLTSEIDELRVASVDLVLFQELRHVDVLRTKALSSDWASFDRDWNRIGPEPLSMMSEL